MNITLLIDNADCEKCPFKAVISSDEYGILDMCKLTDEYEANMGVNCPLFDGATISNEYDIARYNNWRIA